MAELYDILSDLSNAWTENRKILQHKWNFFKRRTLSVTPLVRTEEYGERCAQKCLMS